MSKLRRLRLLSAGSMIVYAATWMPANAGWLTDFIQSPGQAIQNGVNNLGKTIEKGAHDAGNAIEKGTHDTGNAIEKGTHDAGNAIEKGTHDAGNAIEKGTHDTGHAIEKASQDTAKFAKDHPVEFAIIAAAIGGGAYLAFVEGTLTITFDNVPIIIIEGTKTSGLITAGVSEVAGGTTAYLVSEQDLKARTQAQVAVTNSAPNAMTATVQIEPRPTDTLATNPNQPADRSEAASSRAPTTTQLPVGAIPQISAADPKDVVAAFRRADLAIRASQSASTLAQRADAMAHLCAAMKAIEGLSPSEADKQTSDYWDDHSNFPHDVIELFAKGMLERAFFLVSLAIEPHPSGDGTFGSDISREQMLAALRKENDRQMLLLLGDTNVDRFFHSPLQDRIKAMSDELLRHPPGQATIDVPQL